VHLVGATAQEDEARARELERGKRQGVQEPSREAEEDD
jgi:hypothetical protein